MLTISHAVAVLALLVPLGASPDAAGGASESSKAVQPESADLPTASSLFDAYIEATGGLAAHQRQQDRTLEGVYRLVDQDETQIIRVFASAPNNFRAEIEAPALGTTIRCTNGDTAWGVNLSGKPFMLSAQERSEILDNGFFLSEAGYKDRYSKITTESLGKVEGRASYRVEFETPAGITGAIYFDAENKLLTGREVVSIEDPNRTAIVIVSDYQDVGGILIPMKQRQRLTSQSGAAVEVEFRWVKANTGDMPSFDPPAALLDGGEG
jgi:hypothetical protein